MKNIIDSINESSISGTVYKVSLIGAVNTDELPLEVSIVIDSKKDQKEFEKWLENQQGNVFEHAAGGNVEY